MISKIITSLFAAGMFFNAVIFLPQAVKIYKLKSSKDVSLITFCGFCLTQIFAVCYGFLQGDIIMATGYISSLTTCGVVTALACKYKNR